MCSTGCETPLECLTGALRALSGQDLTSSFGPAMLERAGVLARARNVLAADLARTVRECELTQAPEHDGKATMASWLRGHHRLPQAVASQLVRTGRALQQLPALAAAAAEGVVPPEAVAVIAPVASEVNVARAQAQGVDLPEIDALLTEIAATRPHADLRQAVGHYLDRLDPDGTEPDPTGQRSIFFSKHTDGTLSFHGRLDAIGGEKFQAAIESILQASRPAGDLRTRAQQAGDALVQLCDNALASGNLPVLRGHKPHVVVTIDLDDLVDPHPGAGAARTGFGGIISAAKARWLACDGNVTRIVIGPDGQPLDVGRSKRLFPPHLRRAVETRDQHCVFAGCDAPSWWCDIHHLVHWADGGDTSLENSGLLCERHHTKVHHGFRIERQPDGRWRTYRPDGTEILVLDPFLIPA
ncbi:HNH endonuclease signature motif containing protein [Blastococcus sp. CCUG 61487]|uniref:HNH endonuclease signature motif containing protein n=1 Tax=Blastococcus sp. CCUG 61487 TaxID=1840703 RepID=UPI0010C0138F|nr:HNH endonuclease signature motif containing protein [Blastococcus sp. CCUG 61487]TKJ18196.1 endonuclease [Blastococcus sp. CCUG 61487]